jgi:hypothetical protein
MRSPARIAGTMPHPNRSKRTMSPSVWPKPEEVKQAREGAGLTPKQAAALVHTSANAWEKWEAAATSDAAKRMHPSTWELFQAKIEIMSMLETGEISAEAVRRMKVYLPPLPGGTS